MEKEYFYQFTCVTFSGQVENMIFRSDTFEKVFKRLQEDNNKSNITNREIYYKSNINSPKLVLAMKVV